jgi:hypothetical protein
MELPQQLKNEIWDYCRLNNITNIDEFTVKLVKQGFTVEKFGSTPSIAEKIVEKIVEKVVEVPVEVEKVVEKIVEVTVEKEVYITDDSHTKKLTDEIERLEGLNKTHEEHHLTLAKELKQLSEQFKTVQKELEEEKKKKKTDIYGE